MVLKKAELMPAKKVAPAQEPPHVSIGFNHYRVTLNGRSYSRHKDSCHVRYFMTIKGVKKAVWKPIRSPELILQIDELIKEFEGKAND
jgi:hypothetical protein